jgi:hypothetical protein
MEKMSSGGGAKGGNEGGDEGGTEGGDEGGKEGGVYLRLIFQERKKRLRPRACDRSTPSYSPTLPLSVPSFLLFPPWQGRWGVGEGGKQRRDVTSEDALKSLHVVLREGGREGGRGEGREGGREGGKEGRMEGRKGVDREIFTSKYMPTLPSTSLPPSLPPSLSPFPAPL